MSEERLQKILSKAGICSRRKAEELIEAGMVTVNGRIAELGDRANAEEDFIKVDGRRVPKAVPNRYLVLHKPEGYVSTVSDPEGRPTVMDLIPAGMRKAMVPIGRLDFRTEGLLLMTTDGEFAQRVAHPRYGCTKVYEVKVKGMPGDEEVARLREGMWIDGKRTEPADVSFLRRTKARGDANNTWWRVTLGEGRTRQIREMFFRVGHSVQRLRRIAIGSLEDRNLEKGHFRELTPQEVAAFRELTKGELTKGAGKKSKVSKPAEKKQTIDAVSSSEGSEAAVQGRYRAGERKLRQAAADAGKARSARKRAAGAKRSERGQDSRKTSPGKAEEGSPRGSRPSKGKSTGGKPTGGKSSGSRSTGGRPGSSRSTGSKPSGSTRARKPSTRSGSGGSGSKAGSRGRGKPKTR